MFSIDYKSRTPIYQQIMDNIEKLAARGILAPDSQLPSVRALAVQLSTNPNTIAKAYNELESKGVIYSLPGRGSFISSDRDKLREIAIDAIKSSLDQAAFDGAKLGLQTDDFLTLARLCWQKINDIQEGKEGYDLDRKPRTV